MDIKLAESIAHHFDQYLLLDYTAYEMEKLSLDGGFLPHFHSWTNKKRVIAGYQISKPSEEGYYVLFIDWPRNDNYYMVVYVQNKTSTLAEIHRTIVSEDKGLVELSWSYTPLKRDGRNADRKTFYKQAFGSITVQIPVPQTADEVESFIDQLFKICRNRVYADRIVDILEGKWNE